MGSLIWGMRLRRPNLEVTKKATRTRINFILYLVSIGKGNPGISNGDKD
jgi:hypothetical protein